MDLEAVTLGSALAVLLSCLAVLGTVCTGTAVVVLTREKARQNASAIARLERKRQDDLNEAEQRRKEEREEAVRKHTETMAQITKEIDEFKAQCLKYQLDTAGLVKGLTDCVQAMKIDLTKLDARVEHHINPEGGGR